METLTRLQSEPQPPCENPTEARLIDAVGLPWFKFRHANLRDPRIARLSPVGFKVWMYLLDACSIRAVVDAESNAWPRHDASRLCWLDVVDLSRRAYIEGEDLRDALHELWKAGLAGFCTIEDGQLRPVTHVGEATDLTTIVVGLGAWELYDEQGDSHASRPRTAQRKRVQRTAARNDRNCHAELELDSKIRKLASSVDSQDQTTPTYPQPPQKPEDRSGSPGEVRAPSPSDEPEEPVQPTPATRAERVEHHAAGLWQSLRDSRDKHRLPPLLGAEGHRRRIVEVWADMLDARVTVTEIEQQIEARCLESLTAGVDFANSNGWSSPTAIAISSRLAAQRREYLRDEQDRQTVLAAAPKTPPKPARASVPEPKPEDLGPTLFETDGALQRMQAMMAASEALA